MYIDLSCPLSGNMEQLLDNILTVQYFMMSELNYDMPIWISNPVFFCLARARNHMNCT